jgi:hypothetical protein
MMVAGTRNQLPVATVDVAQLNTLRWGPMRQLFPSFVEEIELGRYLKRLLANAECQAVQLEPHRAADGTASPHVFDVYCVPSTGWAGQTMTTFSDRVLNLLRPSAFGHPAAAFASSRRTSPG